MAAWRENGCQQDRSLTLVTVWVWKLWLPLPSITRGNILLNASPGNDPSSKSEVQFLLNSYDFCPIIRLESSKSTIVKSGTICIRKWLGWLMSENLSSQSAIHFHHELGFGSLEYLCCCQAKNSNISYSWSTDMGRTLQITWCENKVWENPEGGQEFLKSPSVLN